MESWGGSLVSCFSYLASLSEQHLSISIDSLAVILILLLALSSLLCCLPFMFCCVRRKAKSDTPYSRKEIICKKGLFALMLARLDEFDTLTPLILTPSGPSIFQEIVQTPVSQQTALNSYIPRTASDSPPPPRRSSHGKTLIVPLNASKFRTPVIPLLGTPDSRITTFDGCTTKSYATIPEDDEEESQSCEQIDDLISIDRTSISASDQKSIRYFFSSSYNLMLPSAPPEFQIPAPTYYPPDLPLDTAISQQLEEKEVELQMSVNQHSVTNSIESPNCSIVTGSPIETTGSLSDSFYINSDIISSANGSQIVENTGCNASDIQSKYHLHRIEEESEAPEGGVVISRTDHSIISQHNLDTERNLIIPRSISQQFELMRRS